MKNNKNEQKAQEILKALEEMIAKGPWEDSNFLRVIGKDLSEIRENLIAFLRTSHESDNTAYISNRSLQRNDQKEVFISLYSSDGKRIQSWERIVTNLPRQIISRPIYEFEEDIKAAIKHKEMKENEAYVSVFIYPTDILVLSDEKSPKDKFGKKLLSIKDKAIILENINQFVHHSGEYQYLHGRLIKK